MFNLNGMFNPTPMAPPMEAPVAKTSTAFKQMAEAIASGNTSQPFNADAIMSAFPQRAPESDQMSPAEIKRMMLEVGLGMMAAGGKPGATFGGAVGEAGGAAVKSMDDRREKKRRDDRDDREDKTRQLMATLGIAGQYGDTSFRNKKFDYDKTQDDRRYGMDLERLGLDKQRLGMEAKRLEMGDEQIIQGADGISYRYNKLNHSLEPLMNGDQPFRGQSNSLYDDLLKGTLIQQLKDYDPRFPGPSIQERAQNIVTGLQGLQIPGAPAAPGAGGAPKGTSKPSVFNMSQLPDAKANKDKMAQDENGNIYYSDGVQWRGIQRGGK